MARDSELLDLKQAAELLNVSETSLRRWTNAGQLACVRIGAKRERRFRREDLLAFIEEQPADGYTMINSERVEHGSHFCSFYENEVGRTKLAAEFLADGLRKHHAAFLVATQPSADAVIAELEQRRAVGRTKIDLDRLVVLRYQPTITSQLENLERNFEAAVREGAKSIRIVGNVTEGFGNGNPFDDVIEYECGYGASLAKRFPVVTLCQYDAARHTGLETVAVFKAHGEMFRYPHQRLLS